MKINNNTIPEKFQQMLKDIPPVPMLILMTKTGFEFVTRDILDKEKYKKDHGIVLVCNADFGELQAKILYSDKTDEVIDLCEELK